MILASLSVENSVCSLVRWPNSVDDEGICLSADANAGLALAFQRYDDPTLRPVLASTRIPELVATTNSLANPGQARPN